MRPQPGIWSQDTVVAVAMNAWCGWTLREDPKRWKKLTAPSWAATSHMRRALQEGQMPRPLHENGISRSWPRSSQRALANPWARMPHSK